MSFKPRQFITSVCCYAIHGVCCELVHGVLCDPGHSVHCYLATVNAVNWSLICSISVLSGLKLAVFTVDPDHSEHSVYISNIQQYHCESREQITVNTVNLQ